MPLAELRFILNCSHKSQFSAISAAEQTLRSLRLRYFANTSNSRTLSDRVWLVLQENRMAGEGKTPQSPVAADAQLFRLLSSLLQQVESLTNQEEVELRAKIKTIGLEVRKMEIAKELDILSAKLDDVDEMISSTMAENPQVRTLLSSMADIWMHVITATCDERRKFTSMAGEDSLESNEKGSK